jgi:hypothetical protein
VIDEVFERTVEALARRFSRRTFLQRFATAASAAAVAPVAFATRPIPARTLISCSNCSQGARCCDGWTTFCCVINGGRNSCPNDTYMGGWWKCTNYTGEGACHAEKVRYYLDCNRTPGFSCPGGCHCANNNCGNRSTCCNHFRYGQCNTEILGVTEVVCRVVTCVNPSDLFVNCNSTLHIDNATCSHEADCL